MTNNKYDYYYNGKKYYKNELIKLFGNSWERHYETWEKTDYGYKYTFKRGMHSGEEIEIHTKKVTSKKIELDNSFYALDIETSTFFNEKNVDWSYYNKNGVRYIKRLNEKIPLSLPYLCGVREYDFKKFYNSSISNGYIKNMFDEDNYTGYKALRTYDDIINWLKSIVDDADASGTVKFLVIQNNAYEHSFLHSNVYTKLGDGYNYDVNYIQPHKPMKIDIYKDKHLCLRILDTYLLTGKSLKSYGATYGYPKLDKTDDYKSTYTPLDELEDDEYIYNKRDLDISALMFINVVKDLCNATGKTPDEILPRLYTKTGVTRLKNKILFENKYVNLLYNKNDMDKNILNNEIRTFTKCSGEVELTKLYKYNHDCFIGGYVRANEKTVYKILEYVKSIDITSSYPYSMKSKYYGFDYEPVDESFDKLAFLRDWKSKLDKLSKNLYTLKMLYFRNFLLNMLSSKYPFFTCSIIIENVRPKELPNNNSMLIMSSSKLIDTIECEINNGRVTRCTKAVLNVSCVELLNYALIYDFDIVDCSYLEVAKRVSKLPKHMQETINYYYKRKSDFKKLVKAYKTKTLLEVLNSIKDISLNEFEINYIKKNINDADLLIWLEQSLQNAKADLNAQYGINVEQPNHDEILCSENNVYTQKEQDVEQSIFRRNYKVGIMITAWSRLHLIMMSLTLIEAGATIHYWDTDSIKFTTTKPIDDVVKQFNKNVGTFDKCDGIGTYDFEYLKDKDYSYRYFVSGGSKNYWYCNDNKVDFTVSGLSARALPVVNNYFVEKCNYDFRKFVTECLQPMTYFDGESIGTTLTDYESSTHYVECNINGYKFKGYSGVVINQPQSRGLLPTPSRHILSRFYNEYKVRCRPQILIYSDGISDLYECGDNNSQELWGLR